MDKEDNRTDLVYLVVLGLRPYSFDDKCHLKQYMEASLLIVQII